MTSNAAPSYAGLDQVDRNATTVAADRAVGHVGDNGTVALLTVSGSWLYGLAEPDRSDLDLRGVYVAPTDAFLGLTSPPEQFETPGDDTVIFEIGKFMRLAADGNANVLEILFSPRFEILDADGADLVEARHLFVSRQAVSRYLGYANGQAQHAIRIDAGEANGEGRLEASKRRKHLRHTFRLLHQAHQMATLGTFDVVVEPSVAAQLDHLSGLDNRHVAGELEARVAVVRAVADKGLLPKGPDRRALDALLREIRRRHLS